MSKRTMGMLLLIVGLVLAVVSLAADPLGIGTGGGMGWKQWLGAVLGVVAGFTGAWLARKKSS